MAAGSEAARAAHGCSSEPEGRPPAAGPEPARRYRNPAANSCWQDRERVIERRMVKAAEPEVEAEPPAFPPTPAAAATNAAGGCGANGVSDVETLLAKLRAL